MTILNTMVIETVLINYDEWRKVFKLEHEHDHDAYKRFKRWGVNTTNQHGFAIAKALGYASFNNIGLYVPERDAIVMQLVKA